MKRTLSAAVLGLILAATLSAATLPAATLSAAGPHRLVDDLQPLLAPLRGGKSSFSLSAVIHIPDGAGNHSVTVRLNQIDQDSFDLEADHKDYSFKLRRRAGRTELVLPKHGKAFVGTGEVSGEDTLRPLGITERIVGPGTAISGYLPLIVGGDTEVLSLVLAGLLNLKYDDQTKAWSDQKNVSIRFPEPGVADVRVGDLRVQLKSTHSTKPQGSWIPDNYEVVTIDRTELERQLARGVKRALEIFVPSPELTLPQRHRREVPHGELRWIEGQRVVLLQGTPEQIGQAHGKLLRAEAMRCVDSVLFTFGTARTIETGRWFLSDLEAAYQRLAPHIPDDHRRETVALASAMGLDRRLAETVNVFPELFHCSGFAVSGKATKDGKLYHGRVLDYMTTIGLQDSATTFIIAPDGKIPFASVGYAGFIGSVSGMNAKGISLGEMGGRGEGKWDGVPMATLMRRAMEECSTLDGVIKLWKTSPRTCEYYYVFADGKTNQAVGVAATPESIEVIQPGQTHELLGEGIEGTVILSAGSRLEKLRERVRQRYGEIDVQAAQWLMSRPVAMKSNLHNVLFVPQDGVLYVANANHKRPAAERPYVKLNLRALLGEMNREPYQP